jgi:AraC-like DNA-binding protein
MPSSLTGPWGAAVKSDAQRVLGCVMDSRVRGRIENALRSHGSILWFDSFADLRRAISSEGRMTTVVIGMQDSRNETALAFAQAVRYSSTGTAIVVCCDLAAHKEHSMADLAIAGVHDALFAGVNDDGHSARMIIFGACLGGAGDIVIRALSPIVPPSLSRFVDLAVRRPRELRRVADVAAALNVPRQTISRWCRLNRFVGPEELLMWVRLFLVTAILESTDRTLESIAYEMHYGSPTALRNRIREYTGLTSTQLRNNGLRLLMDAFQRRLQSAINGKTATTRVETRPSAVAAV